MPTKSTKAATLVVNSPAKKVKAKKVTKTVKAKTKIKAKAKVAKKK